MSRTYLSKGEQAILFIMIFLVLQEWLKPVMELTGTGYFGLFSAFIALCLLLSLVEAPYVISWPVKLLFIGWFINRVYNDVSLGIFTFFREELAVNFSAIRHAEWDLVTNSFRTFLFFVLIWMLVYLIHHWITVRMSIFYFLVMTIFFIATLDTFSNYDGDMGIVKVLLIGLVMTALLFMKRFILKRNILIDWNAIFKFMIPVTVFVLLIGAVAYMLPKAAPKWPDPVAFIKGYGTGTGEGGIFGDGNGRTNKVGYGENDERLGGSFIADDTLVYNVVSNTRQYWRVETKDVYTSKGWISSDSRGNEHIFSSGENVPVKVKPGPAEDAEEAIVYNYSNYNFVLQPYGIMRVNEQEYGVRMNVDTERVRFDLPPSTRVDEYSLTFSEPTYSYTTLQASTIVNEGMEQYLKLPNSLPDRVRDLAEQITANSTSAYDKARAIERFFGLNGFSYETQNVPIPEDDQDYVDQFLFESKVGYCDNFSTSMVVMLRSIGIPAVWVKGFVTGDHVETLEDGRGVFQITNNEAHSWVEAYIEGVGWMPFEPTIGYANPVNINYDEEEQEEQIPDINEEEEEEEDTPTNEPDQGDTTTPVGKGSSFSLAALKIPAIVLGILALLAAIVLFFTRQKWLPKYYIQQYRRSEPNEASYVVAYERLLKQLAKYGLPRSKEQTLSVYASKVDRYFDTDDMTELTQVYEQLIYSKDVNPSEFEKMKSRWENLMNRTVK